MNAIFDFLGRHLAAYLSKPVKGAPPSATCNPHCLMMALKPGDVLLVEGHSRISQAIKYLTQSTWSHAALYTGPLAGRAEPGGEPHVMVEAEVNEGVVSSPLSKYVGAHTRICRPVGLGQGEIDALVAYVVARLGIEYDMRNVIDLARYLMPTPPVPERFRRRMIAFGSGSPTQAICSTLIAQAFDSLNYPILPVIEWVKGASDERSGPGLVPEALAGMDREILHVRHHSLYTPRDFDISPFFAIVKPTIESDFDYRHLPWAEADRRGPPNK